MTLERISCCGTSLVVSLLSLGESDVRYALIKSGIDPDAFISDCDLVAISAVIAPVVTARVK